jgi:hypothetical protein
MLFEEVRPTYNVTGHSVVDFDRLLAFRGDEICKDSQGKSEGVAGLVDLNTAPGRASAKCGRRFSPALFLIEISIMTSSR